jgi:hypothetical protein
MQARMLAYRLMVLSPILYIGSLALRARTHVNVFEFTACTQKQHHAISAYQPFVTEAAPFRSMYPRDLNRPALRQVAKSWISGSKSGDLQPLLPVHIHDFVRDGIKQEVYRSADLMVMHLMTIAKYEVKEGKADQAAEDLVLAMQLAEVLKYSDPYAVAHSGMQQRSALGHIQEYLPFMSQQAIERCREQLIAVRVQQQPLDHLVRWMRQLYNAERIRQGHEASPIEEVDRFLAMNRMNPEEGLATFTSVPRPVWASTGEVPTMLGELRMASNSQTNFVRKLDEQIEALVLENPEDSGFASISP